MTEKRTPMGAKKIVKFGLAAALAAGVCGMARAADWYVDLNSPAATPDGKSWATAFKDVQAAIDAAATGSATAKDRVHIAPGRYRLTKAITSAKHLCFFGVTDEALKGGAVPEAKQVIFDGQNTVPCFEATAADEFYGITFVNGRRDVYSTSNVDTYAGGGLNAKMTADGVVISNCVFRRCVSGTFRDSGTNARIYGGGVGLSTKSSRVYETLFEDCGITNGSAKSSSYKGGSYMRGGALYGANGALSGCVFRRNFIADPKLVWTATKVGSAVYGVSTLVDNCLFASNYFSTTASAYATMGVEGTGHTFSNLVFIGNSALYGSGFNSGQGCVVSHCSFIGNRTSATGWGCLTSPLSTKTTTPSANLIRNCLFLGNYGADGNNDSSGVCIHTHLGDSSGYVRRMDIQNCAFIGNVSKCGSGTAQGQACVSTYSGANGAYLSVSNCWFEANLSATNSTSCKALVNVGSASNYDVVDCMFKDNVSGKAGAGGTSGGMIYASSGNATYGPTTNASIRNCAFVNNKANNMLYVWSAVTDKTKPGLTIDNCTLVGNKLTSTVPAINNLANASYRTFIYNTALYDNKNGSTIRNLGTSWANHVFSSYIGPQTDARTSFDKDGNVLVDDPKFIDAANGDCRLQRRSPLVDAGRMRDWMDTVCTGRAKSQADLSGMAAVYDASGRKPGCEVVRSPRCRRIERALPDIGAYEWTETTSIRLLAY